MRTSCLWCWIPSIKVVVYSVVAMTQGRQISCLILSLFYVFSVCRFPVGRLTKLMASSGLSGTQKQNRCASGGRAIFTCFSAWYRLSILWSLCLCLSVCLSLFPFISLSLFPFLYLSLSVSLSLVFPSVSFQGWPLLHSPTTSSWTTWRLCFPLTLSITHAHAHTHTHLTFLPTSAFSTCSYPYKNHQWFIPLEIFCACEPVDCVLSGLYSLHVANWNPQTVWKESCCIPRANLTVTYAMQLFSVTDVGQVGFGGGVLVCVAASVMAGLVSAVKDYFWKLVKYVVINVSSLDQCNST